MQDDLMNHTAVIEGTTFIRDAVEYLWNEHRIPLVVAEVGSALGNESSNASLEAILGSALWQVDFSLYCMSINVAGINMQSGINFLFSLWRPKIEEKPGVILPAFYGQIFTAEFVGAGSNVQVANMDLKTDFGSAYAAYENGKLARIAIVNLNLWSRSEDGDDSRPFETFSLSVGSEVKSVKVKKLTSPKGGSATPNDQITWGGMQWTYDNKGIGKQIVDDTEVLPVKNGQVDIKVNESEAVIVSLQR
ncbi:hypothetical protein FQN50_005696 [Emmonsiellopsis sp. PD_5]|nr:hypothetical protein FQN50_005696 [Emmonsiellopsis sp. PD_5]